MTRIKFSKVPFIALHTQTCKVRRIRQEERWRVEEK